MIRKWLLKRQINKHTKVIIKVDKDSVRQRFNVFLRLLWKYVKLFLELMYKPLKSINRLPFPALFVIFLTVMLIGLFTVNKLTFSFWSNTVIAACPMLTQGQYNEYGDIISISPIDKVMEEFNARTISGAYSQAGLVFFALVGMLLQQYRPRKVQVWYQ